MINLMRYLHWKRKVIARWRRIFYRIRRNELVKALGAIFLLAFIAALVVTFIEHGGNDQFSRFGAGLWWAIVTMTTVGYGDIIPQTAIGRIAAGIVMLSGMALISVFTAAVSSTLITRRLWEKKGLSKLSLKNHIAILGWNPAGKDIILAVYEDVIRDNRSLVLVNMMDPDEAEDIINRYPDLHIKYVHGDYTDEAVLQRTNIGFAYAALIIPDESDKSRPKSDERTILATLSVKAIQPKVKVIAHILDGNNEAHLRRANADQVFVSDRYSGYLLGAHVTSPGIPEILDILLSSGGVRLTRKPVPSSLVGSSFPSVSDYYMRQYGAILLGFIVEEMGFELGDILSDDYSAIDRFIREKLAAAGKGLDKKSRVEVKLSPGVDYKVTEKDVAVLIESS